MKIDHCAQKPREEAKQRMIANEENPAPNQEATPEEEELMEKASAPTVRDLRAALKDLFADVETDARPETDSTSPNDSLPQQPY